MQTGVSFVVPVYNKEQWLPRVLDSIIRQAGSFRREYVFVDDGSTDASMDIVRRITAGWNNVVIHEQQNHGSAHATNRGIERASEPYVKFVDADDLLATHATQSLLDALTGSDACLAWGNVVRYRTLDDIDLEARVSSPDIARLAAPLMPALRNSMFNPTQFLARTECLRSVGGCDERVVHSQEYSLTLRLAHRWPFLKVDAPVAFLPAHVPGSLGTNQGRQLRRVTLACACFLDDHPDLTARARQYACRRAAGRAWKFQRRNRGAGFTSPWFRRYVRSKFPIHNKHAEFIKACLSAFDED